MIPAETREGSNGVERQRVKIDKNGQVGLDYDLAIPMMLVQYFPTGLLGWG